MRFLFFFCFVCLFDLYVFQAFATVTGGPTGTWYMEVAALYWSIPFLAVLTVLYFVYNQKRSFNKNLFSIFRAILMIIYLSKFLIAGVLLIDDARRLMLAIYEGLSGQVGLDFSRSLLLSQFGICLGSIPFVLLTYGILRNRYRFKVFKETVNLAHLPEELDGLRIVQISDIHSGSFFLKAPLEAAIELINQQKADLVFFTGDLVNSVASEIIGFIDVFDQIKAKHGVFSILGNHDYGDYVRWETPEAKAANFEQMKKAHKEMGWELMMNEHRMVNVKGAQIAVIGVENYSAHPRFPKYGDLMKAYEGTESAALKLLLSHDPTHWEDEVVENFGDIDITFSGHTHGFQFGFEIPGIFKWSPVKYVYKQWAGLYQEGKQFLYVNRGFGFLGYPGRVGILPEITVIDLKKKEEE